VLSVVKTVEGPTSVLHNKRHAETPAPRQPTWTLSGIMAERPCCLFFRKIHHGEHGEPRRHTEVWICWNIGSWRIAFIGLAIEVHRAVGPGLLEAVYGECLSDELKQAGIPFQREVPVPVAYKGKTLPLGFRADIVAANTILLEIKAVTALLPTHGAQILTYLRMSQIKIGLLLNFHDARLKDGLRRFII
jgi:GxxExxY protein